MVVALTVIEDNVIAFAVTDTEIVPEIEPMLAVITAAPAETAVNTP